MSPTFSSAHPTSSRNFRKGAVTALMISMKIFDQLPSEKAFVRRSHHAQTSCTIWITAEPNAVSPKFFLKSSQLMANAAMTAMSPISIHPTGVPSMAELNSNQAFLSAPNIFTRPPTPPAAPVPAAFVPKRKPISLLNGLNSPRTPSLASPATTLNSPNATAERETVSATYPSWRVMFGKVSMNHSTLPMKRLKTSTASFTGGRSFCHHAADTVLSAAFSLWKGSTIFRAIASAFPMPLMSSSTLMFVASPPVS